MKNKKFYETTFWKKKQKGKNINIFKKLIIKNINYKKTFIKYKK